LRSYYKVSSDQKNELTRRKKEILAGEFLTDHEVKKNDEKWLKK
jgi:hypothetical protein